MERKSEKKSENDAVPYIVVTTCDPNHDVVKTARQWIDNYMKQVRSALAQADVHRSVRSEYIGLFITFADIRT